MTEAQKLSRFPATMGRRVVPALLAVAMAITAGCGHSNRGVVETYNPQPALPLVVKAPPTLAPIDVRPEDVGVDQAMVALLEPYAERVREFQTPIAECAVEMTRPTDQKGDCPLGNWMADVTREGAEAAIGQPVDLALMNAGGIRATMPAGAITREAILKIMPFENKIAVVEIDGPTTQRLLEHLATYPRSFAVSNAVITYDATPALVGATVGGAPFDASRTYRVALSDFLADGGDGVGALLKDGRRTDTGVLVRDALENHARARQAAGLKIQPPAPAPARYIELASGGTGS